MSWVNMANIYQKGYSEFYKNFTRHELWLWFFFNESYQAVHLNNFFLFHFDVDFVGSVVVYKFLCQVLLGH